MSSFKDNHEDREQYNIFAKGQTRNQGREMQKSYFETHKTFLSNPAVRAIQESFFFFVIKLRPNQIFKSQVVRTRELADSSCG